MTTKTNKRTLPVVPLRGLTVFPKIVLQFDAGRDKTVTALQEAMLKNQECILVSQKEARKSNPEIEDIYEVGTVAKIKQIIKLENDSLRVLVEGIERAKIIQYTKTEPYYEAVVEIKEESKELVEVHSQALIRQLKESFDTFAKIDKNVPDILTNSVFQSNVGEITDIIASNIFIDVYDKQMVLETFDQAERAEIILTIIAREIEIKKITKKIHIRVKSNIDKSQKDYFLTEQIKAIRKELGQEDSPDAQGDKFLKKLEELDLSDEIREKAEKEIKRLRSLPPNSHELPMIKTWVDNFFALPWNDYSDEEFDIKKARRVLDADHYGMKNVKDRIIEHLAVCKLRGNAGGTILCLVGPPGVGKTSIGASIARAVNRNFVRMSLGGVRDEADIRGHRRTYIGAIPGRIIDAFKQAKSMNPIILLDEIDKMGNDFRGDPASAMLEVLDSAQNSTFRDHFMEIPFDLSNAMFILTANTTSTIPRPLLDRMEIIELSSYTQEEKVQIAKRHLVAKQLKEHGIKKSNVKISDLALNDIVEFYTREAGVRSLERRVAEICRKIATVMLEEDKTKLSVTQNNLKKYLGAAKYIRDKVVDKDQIGTVNGLAWTSVGGETMTIEAITFSGSGKMDITGQIGDVMRESAIAAYTYIKANAARLGINPKDFIKKDIHIHIPEGAIPKDGPSAGITLATAMVSAFNSIEVKSSVAMTGEITLRGRVLPIGGLKEKSLAAFREGIRTIILPFENKKDVEDIPQQVREQLKLVYAQDIDTVFKAALVKQPQEYIETISDEIGEIKNVPIKNVESVLQA